MSTKRKHLYHMVWSHMVELCAELCRPVTAGELARHEGVARSTVVRWLTDMLAENAIYSFRQTGKNRQTMHTYEPVGRNETWFYAYGETEEEQE